MTWLAKSPEYTNVLYFIPILPILADFKEYERDLTVDNPALEHLHNKIRSSELLAIKYIRLMIWIAALKNAVNFYS